MLFFIIILLWATSCILVSIMIIIEKRRVRKRRVLMDTKFMHGRQLIFLSQENSSRNELKKKNADGKVGGSIGWGAQIGKRIRERREVGPKIHLECQIPKRQRRRQKRKIRINHRRKTKSQLAANAPFLIQNPPTLDLPKFHGVSLFFYSLLPASPPSSLPPSLLTHHEDD